MGINVENEELRAREQELILDITKAICGRMKLGFGTKREGTKELPNGWGVTPPNRTNLYLKEKDIKNLLEKEGISINTLPIYVRICWNRSLNPDSLTIIEDYPNNIVRVKTFPCEKLNTPISLEKYPIPENRAVPYLMNALESLVQSDRHTTISLRDQ